MRDSLPGRYRIARKAEGRNRPTGSGVRHDLAESVTRAVADAPTSGQKVHS